MNDFLINSTHFRTLGIKLWLSREQKQKARLKATQCSKQSSCWWKLEYITANIYSSKSVQLHFFPPLFSFLVMIGCLLWLLVVDWLNVVLAFDVNVACEQAPGEPERSEGACRHSIDAAVMPPMIPATGIMIWLVKSLIVDTFEINIWQVFMKCGWPPYTTPTLRGNCAFVVFF